MDWKDALAGLNAGDFPDPEPESDSRQDAHPDNSAPEKFGDIKVFVERKGRGGKIATILTGFTCSDERLQQIAARLKKRIGTGGSARGGEILLQGSWRDKALEVLRELQGCGS